jgi:hypothetical protein
MDRAADNHDIKPLNDDATGPTATGTRVSRAGRKIRSVGEWWREPRHHRNGHKVGNQEGLAVVGGGDRGDTAGWVPAFRKTLHGSGTSKQSIAKRRTVRRFARRLVPGSSFIRCQKVATEAGHDPPVAPNAVLPAAASPRPQSPCVRSHDVLASAMRVSTMEEDLRATPTRRVLQVSASSETGDVW